MMMKGDQARSLSCDVMLHISLVVVVVFVIGEAPYIYIDARSETRIITV